MVHIETLRQEFSSRLKEAMTDHGIALWGAGVRLAKIAGVTPKAANKWLNAETIPAPEKMHALCVAFGVRREWLEYGEGHKKPNNSKQQPDDDKATAGENQGAYQAERAEALMDFATPRTRTVLERINQAARMGRLSEADIDLLDQIAARFESSAGPAAGSEGSHGRLREKLQNHDPHSKQ